MDDAACETSSASNTATIVVDGKRSFTTGSAYAVCRIFFGNRVALAGTWAKMLATLWDN
jgi:hypothetical protein